jgi:hypothetical protein
LIAPPANPLGAKRIKVFLLLFLQKKKALALVLRVAWGTLSRFEGKPLSLTSPRSFAACLQTPP